MKLVGEYDWLMSKELPPSRVAPQFVVRLPDEAFRDRLAAAAKERGRSMNSEIVARLEASFDDGPNEFAEWERYKIEASHRLKLEGAKVTSALLAGCYMALYAWARNGELEENKESIEGTIKVAETLIARAQDGTWERFQAEYDVAKEKHEALLSQLETLPLPAKKSSKNTSKKGG